MSRWVKANPEQWFWLLGAPLWPGRARGKLWKLEMKEWGQTSGEICGKFGPDPPQTLGKAGAIPWPLLLEDELGGNFELV